MHSLPKSYRLALQTITTKQASAAMGGSTTKKIKPEDLMNFFIEEAQHHIINAEHSKNGDSALAVHGKKGKRGKGSRGEKSKSNVTCDNCS
jgi:hypothetical protein